jgi:hypothetical protein
MSSLPPPDGPPRDLGERDEPDSPALDEFFEDVQVVIVEE